MFNSTQVQPVQRAAISVPEAAKSAGLGRSSIYKAILNNSLPTLKVGGRRLVRPDDLTAWLARHTA